MQALENLGNATFVGVNEMWELSTLLLYDTFPGFRPKLNDFLLGSSENAADNIELQPNVRTNTDDAYLRFKESRR